MFFVVLFVIGLAILFLRYFFSYLFISRFQFRRRSPKDCSTAVEAQTVDSNDFSHSYQRKYIFTLNEKNEFRKLAAWAAEHNYYVFPKMRLADIIEPRRTGENYMSLFGKIRAKHVDFVICDRECRIKFIIELDDNSHDSQKRAERDVFVDHACQGAGYKVIHTRAITDDLLADLLTQDSAGT